MSRETINIIDEMVASVDTKMQIFTLTLSDFASSMSVLQKLSQQLSEDQQKITVDISGDMCRLFEMQESFKHISNICHGYLSDIKKAEKK
jgi:hypothetical protein